MFSRPATQEAVSLSSRASRKYLPFYLILRSIHYPVPYRSIIQTHPGSIIPCYWGSTCFSAIQEVWTKSATIPLSRRNHFHSARIIYLFRKHDPLLFRTHYLLSWKHCPIIQEALFPPIQEALSLLFRKHYSLLFRKHYAKVWPLITELFDLRFQCRGSRGTLGCFLNFFSHS